MGQHLKLRKINALYAKVLFEDPETSITKNQIRHLVTNYLIPGVIRNGKVYLASSFGLRIYFAHPNASIKELNDIYTKAILSETKIVA